VMSDKKETGSVLGKRPARTITATPAAAAAAEAVAAAAAAVAAAAAAAAAPAAAEAAEAEPPAKKNSGPKGAPLLARIIELIREDKKPAGTSLVKLGSVLKATFPDKLIKKTLKKAVEDGVLIQNRASYLVAGDPAYKDTTDKVTVTQVNQGMGDRVAAQGDAVSVYYTGQLFEGGIKFDEGILTFEVGAGDVIKGMDYGVVGMKVNERRTLIIPPSLGYGKRGSGPSVPPNRCVFWDTPATSLCPALTSSLPSHSQRLIL
jgi:hypothetical protein